QRRLRLVAVPHVLFAGDVCVEDGLVLELVAAESPAEGVLAPDDLAADLEARGFERVLELALPGGAVADVQRRTGFRHRAVSLERVPQEPLEIGIRHTVAFDLQSLLGVALVIYVVGGISEYEV